jgi:hypothetical protein
MLDSVIFTLYTPAFRNGWLNHVSTLPDPPVVMMAHVTNTSRKVTHMFFPHYLKWNDAQCLPSVAVMSYAPLVQTSLQHLSLLKLLTLLLNGGMHAESTIE